MSGVIPRILASFRSRGDLGDFVWALPRVRAPEARGEARPSRAGPGLGSGVGWGPGFLLEFI